MRGRLVRDHLLLGLLLGLFPDLLGLPDSLGSVAERESLKSLEEWLL